MSVLASPLRREIWYSLFSLCVLVCIDRPACAQDVDTVTLTLSDTLTQDSLTEPSRLQRFVSKISDLHFLAVPSITVSPETSWGFGVAGAYYFTAKGQNKLSDIGFDAAYTLRHQWNVNINSTIYLNHWQIWTRVGYRKYPDYYYGRGNHYGYRQQNPVYYEAGNAYLTLQPQYYIDKHWSVGGNLVLYYDDAKTKSELSGYSVGSTDQLLLDNVSGLNEKLLMLGIGFIASYDTRDEIYYPSKGLLAKVMLTHYESPLNTDYRLGKLNIDFRHYLTIYKQLIFAYQFRSEMTFGKDIPYQMRSVLGGRDLVRGIRQGMFSDDAYFALQGELRYPIWKVIRGTVFCGVGDVYNFSNWQWAKPKVGYGLGLRVSINKSKVNIRFDVARNNVITTWKKAGWNFYLTMKEAF